MQSDSNHIFRLHPSINMARRESDGYEKGTNERCDFNLSGLMDVFLLNAINYTYYSNVCTAIQCNGVA